MLKIRIVFVLLLACGFTSLVYGLDVERPISAVPTKVTAFVTYELNGGVTNPWGWTCPQDMYETLNEDWNAFSGSTTVWSPLTEVSGNDIALGIPTQASSMDASFLDDQMFKTHFEWLVTYMNAKCIDASVSLSSISAALRYNLAAFFGNGHRTMWPVGPDYTTAGVNNYEAYKDYWKAAYDNPISPTETFTLNAPYKENATFDGWYTDPTFLGERVTTVDATTTGLLYAKWIEDTPIVSEAGWDTYLYPARGANGEYTLQNDWIFSNTLDNFADNRPANAFYARGMVALDGVMYFPDRENAQLVRVDGETGKRIAPVKFADNIFTQVYKDVNGYDSIGAARVILPYNDLQVDNAGNLLVGACISNGQIFQIWKVDETTGKGTLVVEENLWANPQNDSISYRFDAFGVYGNVDERAIIMAADANSMTVFKWTINEGKVDGLAQMIDLYVDPSNNSYLIQGDAMITSPGVAPRVVPMNEGYFYLDGNATYPTLFDMHGILVDDFKNCVRGTKVANNDGDTCVLHEGHNGVVEFQIGDDYFLLMAATNTVFTPNSAFALYKYKDAAKSFAELEPLWFFPSAGMGNATCGYRSAPVSVEVNQETGMAHLYVYAGENGYGRYTLKGKPNYTAIPVSGISLEQAEVNLRVNSTLKLKATVYPENATNKKIRWTSDNPNIASVNKNGIVVGNAVGETYIHATTESGNYVATCKVIVLQALNVITSIELSPHDTTLTVGESFYLDYVVQPENYCDQLWYRCTDSNIVSIEGDGRLYARSVGVAKVYMYAQNLEQTQITAIDSCVVTVVRAGYDGDSSEIPVNEVLLDISLLELFVGKTYQLAATVLPANASNKELVWESDNKNVATVERGLVQAVGRGTSTITALSVESGYQAVCLVIVSDDTALDNMDANEVPTVRKVFEDGTIYILRKGERYMIDGRVVK